MSSRREHFSTYAHIASKLKRNRVFSSAMVQCGIDMRFELQHPIFLQAHALDDLQCALSLSRADAQWTQAQRPRELGGTWEAPELGLRSWVKRGGDGPRVCALQEDFCMGAVSGAFAAAATTPLDVIKTSMMCSAASRPTMRSAASHVIANVSAAAPPLASPRLFLSVTLCSGPQPCAPGL